MRKSREVDPNLQLLWYKITYEHEIEDFYDDRKTYFDEIMNLKLKEELKKENLEKINFYPLATPIGMNLTTFRAIPT